MKLWEFWKLHNEEMIKLDSSRLYGMIAFLTGYLGLSDISYDAVQILEKYINDK
jgi:hypothetical protein